MLFPFRGEQLPRPMLMKYARSADRATRRECYEVLGTTLEAHSEQLDGIFDRLVHVRDRMARKMGYENFIELGYCRMERMCYDVQAVQTFRENIVRDIVPVVSRLRLENAKRLGIDTFRLYDNEAFTPRRRSDTLRQGGALCRCAEDVRRHGRRAGHVFPHDVPKRGLRRRCAPEQVGRRLLHGVCQVSSAVHPRKLQRHLRRRGRRDARGRSRAQRLPDRGQPLRARARLRRHGDRRNALDEHGVFRLAVSRRLFSRRRATRSATASSMRSMR